MQYDFRLREAQLAEKEMELLKRELNMMIVSGQAAGGGFGGGVKKDGHGHPAPPGSGNTPTPKKRKGKLREKLLKQKQGDNVSSVISLPSGKQPTWGSTTL